VLFFIQHQCRSSQAHHQKFDENIARTCSTALVLCPNDDVLFSGSGNTTAIQINLNHESPTARNPRPKATPEKTRIYETNAGFKFRSLIFTLRSGSITCIGIFVSRESVVTKFGVREAPPVTKHCWMGMPGVVLRKKSKLL